MEKRKFYVIEEIDPCRSCNGAGVVLDAYVERKLEERKTFKRLNGGWDGKRGWTLQEANDLPNLLFIQCVRCCGQGKYKEEVLLERALQEEPTSQDFAEKPAYTEAQNDN